MVIKKNDDVKWINKDIAFHTVTSITKEKIIDNFFNSGILAPGSDFSFQFEDTGDFIYFDTIHPWIKGSISVK